MLEDSGLPKTLWAEAATTASYLRNRAPAAGRSSTPWEAFCGNKPDVSHLRVFGARAYALQPKELRRKLDSHAISGVMVGYEPNVKGYRILTDDGKVIMTGDVAFDETKSGEQRPEARQRGAQGARARRGEQSTAVGAAATTTAPLRTATPMTARATTVPTTWRLRTATPLEQRRPPGDWWAGEQALQATAAGGGDPTTMAEALASDNAQHWAAGHGRRDRVAGDQRHVDTGGGAARRAGHTRQVGVQDEAQRGRKRGALQSTPGGKGLPAAGGRRLHRGLRSSEQARHSASAAGAPWRTTTWSCTRWTSRPPSSTASWRRRCTWSSRLATPAAAPAKCAACTARCTA